MEEQRQAKELERFRALEMKKADIDHITTTSPHKLHVANSSLTPMEKQKNILLDIQKMTAIENISTYIPTEKRTKIDEKTTINELRAKIEILKIEHGISSEEIATPIMDLKSTAHTIANKKLSAHTEGERMRIPPQGNTDTSGQVKRSQSANRPSRIPVRSNHPTSYIARCPVEALGPSNLAKEGARHIQPEIVTESCIQEVTAHTRMPTTEKKSRASNTCVGTASTSISQSRGHSVEKVKRESGEPILATFNSNKSLRTETPVSKLGAAKSVVINDRDSDGVLFEEYSEFVRASKALMFFRNEKAVDSSAVELQGISEYLKASSEFMMKSDVERLASTGLI